MVLPCLFIMNLSDNFNLTPYIWFRTMQNYDNGGPSGLGRAPYSSTEHEQLKQDYMMAMEKLNQTMNSIKTFWSPELKVFGDFYSQKLRNFREKGS